MFHDRAYQDWFLDRFEVEQRELALIQYAISISAGTDIALLWAAVGEYPNLLVCAMFAEICVIYSGVFFNHRAFRALHSMLPVHTHLLFSSWGVGLLAMWPLHLLTE